MTYAHFEVRASVKAIVLNRYLHLIPAPIRPSIG
jgi:hypothetical protein